MRRGLWIILVAAGLCASADARERYWNYAQQGGQPVNVAGLNSTTLVQQTYISATITVYAAGTQNLATLYADNLSPSTPLANPFTASITGYFEFYASAGRYDVRVNGTLTWGDIELCDPLGPNADPSCTSGQGTPLVNWFLDNSLVGIEPGGDLDDASHGGSNITITASNDASNNRVHYVFSLPLTWDKTFNLQNFTDTTASGVLQFELGQNAHITRVYCSVVGATNLVANLDARSESTPNTDTGNHLLGSDITCSTTGVTTSTFANGASQCGGTSTCAVPLHTNIVLTLTSQSGGTSGDGLRLTVEGTIP